MLDRSYLRVLLLSGWAAAVIVLMSGVAGGPFADGQTADCVPTGGTGETGETGHTGWTGGPTGGTVIFPPPPPPPTGGTGPSGTTGDSGGTPCILPPARTAGTAAQQRGDKVRVRVRCPRSARPGCKVKLVGRLARRGPNVTETLKRKLRPGTRRSVALTIRPEFLDQAHSAGEVIVRRLVRKGGAKPKRSFVSRPIGF